MLHFQKLLATYPPHRECILRCRFHLQGLWSRHPYSSQMGCWWGFWCGCLHSVWEPEHPRWSLWSPHGKHLETHESVSIIALATSQYFATDPVKIVHFQQCTENTKWPTCGQTTISIFCSRLFYLCSPLLVHTHEPHWHQLQAPHWAWQGNWAHPGHRSGWWGCMIRDIEEYKWWCRSHLHCLGCEPQPQCHCLRWSRWSGRLGQHWYSRRWTLPSLQP